MEHRVVAARSHEEQHGNRRYRAGAGIQEGDACHPLGLLRHGRAAPYIGFRPRDQAVLDAPDHAPDGQENQPADASAMPMEGTAMPGSP